MPAISTVVGCVTLDKSQKKPGKQSDEKTKEVVQLVNE